MQHGGHWRGSLPKHNFLFFSQSAWSLSSISNILPATAPKTSQMWRSLLYLWNIYLTTRSKTRFPCLPFSPINGQETLYLNIKSVSKAKFSCLLLVVSFFFSLLLLGRFAFTSLTLLNRIPAEVARGSLSSIRSFCRLMVSPELQYQLHSTEPVVWDRWGLSSWFSCK